MNPDLKKLTAYVNAVSDLAESVERDIKNGNKISSDTVLRLSKLIAAVNKVASLIDNLHINDLKYTQ